MHTPHNSRFSINCKGKLICFNDIVVLGILNTTPDSFYDGGQFNRLDFAIEHTAKMLAEGADIIDIGGASSKPNATEVSVQEELDRVIPVIEKLKSTFKDILISIDTYQSVVAKQALSAGASIINDISGGSLDVDMFKFVAKNQIPYILTHIQGNPRNMQENPVYKDVVLDVLKELSEKIMELENLGAKDIIIDPGFGFGKTEEQNYQLLSSLNLFHKALNKPVLAGLSRKSMLYKPLDISPKESLSATIAANVIALQNGAKLLRVHDVKAAKDAIKVFNLSKF